MSQPRSCLTHRFTIRMLPSRAGAGREETKTCQRTRRVAQQIALALTVALGCNLARCEPPIPAAAARPLDREHGFAILVWQYKTDAQQDASLYESVGLRGFHIDRGLGSRPRVQWAQKKQWTYYIDHAAGKGILHLTPRTGLDRIPKDGSPAARPLPLVADSTFNALAAHLDENLPDAVSDRTLAIALDDEISLGTFNSPLELDHSEASIEQFRAWLKRQYPSPEAFERAWPASSRRDNQALPQTYESVRKSIVSDPPSRWRLAPWMDFRTFNDHAFSECIRRTTRHAVAQAQGAPVGFVGGQQPSAYGGYDYSRLRHSVQFIESYDIGGTNEILRSFWSEAPRKPHVQTYFLSGKPSVDRWFLWYYLVHGNRGVIAWPSVQGKPWFDGGEIHPSVRALNETFRQVQASELAPLSDPLTEPLFDPIAILVSQPSARLGWAIDASAHGKTWPRRSSSLDNSCNSVGKNRVAWTRTLEDIGFQAHLIDENELAKGVLDESMTRVLILPQTLAMAPETCETVKQFVRNGGVVIADYLPALTDQHGTGYAESPLAEVFGVQDKVTPRDPWFDGRRRYEINGEKYNRPFAERISDSDCLIRDGQSLIHRDLNSSWIRNRFGRGVSILINQSPTRLFDSELRGAELGSNWRRALSAALHESGLTPIVITDGPGHGIECLRYKLADTEGQIWCWVSNPTRQASVDGAGKSGPLAPKPIRFAVTPSRSMRSQITSLTNLRTGAKLPVSWPLKLEFPGDEALVLKVEF